MMKEQYRGDLDQMGKHERESQQQLIIQTLVRDLAGVYMNQNENLFLEEVDRQRENNEDNIAEDMAAEVLEDYALRRPPSDNGSGEPNPDNYEDWLGITSGSFSLDEMGGTMIYDPELRDRIFPSSTESPILRRDDFNLYQYDVEELANIVGTIETLFRRVVTRDENAGDMGSVIVIGGTVGETLMPHEL